MFKVSVKGIIFQHDAYLLRVNERKEYELLGGKLEHTDKSLAARVHQEFLEESGIEVEPQETLEPWFYVIGGRPVFIVPLHCDITHVPSTLFDQDGGRLEWVAAERLETISMPQGYLDSILHRTPHLTELVCDSGPHYEDDRFRIVLEVHSPNGKQLHELTQACDISCHLHTLGYVNARFEAVQYTVGHAIHVVYRVDSS